MTHDAMGTNCSNNDLPSKLEQWVEDYITSTSSWMERPPNTPHGQIMSESPLLGPTCILDEERENTPYMYCSSPPTVQTYPTQTNQPLSTIPPAITLDDPFWDEPNLPSTENLKPQPQPQRNSDPGSDKTYYDSDKENHQPDEEHYVHSRRIAKWKKLDPDPLFLSLRTEADYNEYAEKQGLVFTRRAPATPKKRRRRRSHDGQHDQDVEGQPSPPKKRATDREQAEDAPGFERPAYLEDLAVFQVACDEVEQSYNIKKPYHYSYPPFPSRYQVPWDHENPQSSGGLGLGNLNLDSRSPGVRSGMKVKRRERHSGAVMQDRRRRDGKDIDDNETDDNGDWDQAERDAWDEMLS